MKPIDTYLNELPEPERTLCLEARAKAKKRRSEYYHDAQTAGSMANAIMFGFGWKEDGGDYDKFRAIHKRAEAGEFDTPAPKKMAADPLAERMDAMYTDIMDRLDTLRMGQMDQDVSETLNRIEGSVNSHGSAIATAQGHIVQRLTLIESSVAVIRSGATFMQQLEQDAPSVIEVVKAEMRSISDRLDALRFEQYALAGKEQDAPESLQDGDYTDASKEVADELTAMNVFASASTKSYRHYTFGSYYGKPRVMGNNYENASCSTYLDRSTFLARARVTAQELGPKAVEPEPLKVGDWVRITEDPGNGSPYRWLDIVRVGSVDGEWAVIASDGPLPGSRSILRRKLEKLSKDEIATHDHG